ncbi:MAG: hypothetical protein U9N77_06615 [Thermodesulfobacteriota bacterium]|nr:hypothetical protein [Thermodesulfobacteriota bacterium]
MDTSYTSVDEDNFNLYCPTCGAPRADIRATEEETFKTFSCHNCGQALGTGILLNLKVICPKCKKMVIMT